jgi:hypothetical protein
MTKGFLLSAAAAVATLASAPILAQDNARQNNARQDKARQDNARAPRTSGRELGYFLPRVRVGTVVSELILRCPSADDPSPRIATSVVIAGKARPDPLRFINVDARHGILSSRTTKLGLRADGTLSTFNASTEGQGGEVLSALIGAAATVASFGFGIPALPGAAVAATNPARREPALHCNAMTEQRVARMNRLETELESLRSSVATGGQREAAARVLTELTAELAEVVGQLSLETTAHFDPNRADFVAPPGVPPPSQQLRGIGRVAYGQWFKEENGQLEAGLETENVRGRFGYLATLTPDRAMFNALAGDDTQPFPDHGETTPFLFYLRPVPATIVVNACTTPVANNACSIDARSDAVSKRETVPIPQLSGPFSISIGSGGVFGTRSAAATFDEQGAPLTLEYGSTTGGAAIAGVINAGTTGVTTVRGAENAAITVRLAREEALAKLDVLLNGPAPAPAPATDQ